MSVWNEGARRGGTPEQQASWINDPKVRGYIVQAAMILVLLLVAYEIVVNTRANLEKLNKGFGFDFLSDAAGFDIIQKLIPYSSTSSYGRAILVGFWNTILVSVLGIFFATLLGFLIGIMRLSKNWIVNKVATVYVETIRNVPLLLQIFIWYGLVLKPLPGVKEAISFLDLFYLSNRGLTMPAPVPGDGAGWPFLLLLLAVIATVLISRWARKRQEATGEQFPSGWLGLALIIGAPLLGVFLARVAYGAWPYAFDYPALAGFNFKGGLTIIPEFMALLVALSIYTAAFIAEIVRAGIQAVSHGQTEAAHALGIRSGPTLRLVVIPQALRVIIPPLTSQFLNLTKNSSLAVAIAYPDLVAMGGTVNNQSGRAIEVVLIWMVVYLSLSLLTSAFMNWYNSRKKLVER